MNGAHMSALLPRPGTSNSGSPSPRSVTQIRCPRHEMKLRSNSSLRRAEELDGAFPQRRGRATRDDTDVSAGSRTTSACGTIGAIASTPAGGAIVSFSAETDSTGIVSAATVDRPVADASPCLSSEPFAPGPNLLIELRQQAARRGHDVVDPGRHRAHVAQAVGRVVEPIPQVADAARRRCSSRARASRTSS